MHLCLMSEDAKVYAEKVEILEIENAKLKSELLAYKRHLFGKKSERYLSSGMTLPGQQMFDPTVFGISLPSQISKEDIPAVEEKKKDAQKPVRKEFDESKFEVITEEIQPDADTSELKYMGVEVSTHQVLVDAKIVIKKIKRYKYINTETGEIVLAEMPYRPFAKSQVSSSIVSEVLVQKYVDGMPIYRQQQAWKRLGVDFPYSSLSDMQRSGYEIISPLFKAFIIEVRNTNYLQVDESPFKVLTSEKKGATHIGYQWIYLDPVRSLVLYDYQSGRSAKYPDEMLKDYKGIIQTDGYTGYNRVADKEGIKQIYCLAHARRYFEKALSNHKEPASYFLEEVQKIYAIERQILDNDITGENKVSYRQKYAMPILQNLQQWLKDQLPQITPKSTFGKAVLYSSERWEGLMAYCNYAHAQIDNNPVERSIRPMVIGRKNYLFTKTDESAKRIACFYSFFITCRLHNVNPKAWIEDVFNKIEIIKPSEYHTLFPQNWGK
jgi:transposase